MVECQHCGSEVTEQFARVFGDNEGTVHRCRCCDSSVRLAEGTAAGLEGETPDPETSPGRHGDQEGSTMEQKEMNEFAKATKPGLWPSMEVDFS